MKVEVSEKTIAYTEVLNIILHLENEYFEKIPKKYIEFLEENSLEDYRYYDTKGKLKISNLTEQILSYFNLEYWCDEEERKELLKKYEENDKKINEKYDIQKIFDERKNKVIDNDREKEEVVSLTVQKENIIQKIFNKIKRIFKIK